MKRLSLVSLLALYVSACTMAPKYIQPTPPVASNWPVEAPTTSAAELKWQDLFLDPALQATINTALTQNRDLRISVFNIDKARAQYGIQRANIFPAISGSLSDAHIKAANTPEVESVSANVGLSAYEIDLFGRVRSLNKSALEAYLATDETRKAVQISLISSVATAWLNLASDSDTLALSRQTLAGREDTLKIAQGRARIGVLNDLDLAQIEGLAESARVDVGANETKVDQDKAALTLLVGAPLTDTMMPSGLKLGLVADNLPVGLPSDVLLKRPDVLSAEHSLKAANADIGAARAAFFPRVTLTGSTGSSSPDLSGLFKSGTDTWSFTPAISVPIFAGGANVAGLKSAKASRDIAVATYEKAIQQAFSDVSQALAVRARIDDRLNAQAAATAAAQRSLTLSQARYDNGVDSYLTLLDAQRTLYAAQQTLISLQALKATNLVALYKSLGNDQSLN